MARHGRHRQHCGRDHAGIESLAGFVVTRSALDSPAAVIQGFDPSDRDVYPLYEVIAEAGLPALFHSGQTGIGAAIRSVQRAFSAVFPQQGGSFDHLFAPDETFVIGALQTRALHVPGHTPADMAFQIGDAVFVGDTLFAMGCGRLFEGTAAQMYDNMRKLEALGDDTAIYCAHEYTLSNARFAMSVEPDNAALQERVSDVVAARERGEATVPTTIALERATNPFMRARSVEELAARRAAKDAA